MITNITDFRNKIEIKDVEGNHTYLSIVVNGRKYGQSYPNTVNTIEGMKDNFVVFYYPIMIEDNIKELAEKYPDHYEVKNI